MEYTCKDAIEMLADIATVIIAGIALYYAWRTYGVAKEAKDEWKNEKNLDIFVRFSKVFPSSREMIISLRNPLSYNKEVEDEIKKSNENGEPLSEDHIKHFKALITLQSRYRIYESKINELMDLEYETLFLLGDDNIVSNYIRFIKITKENIFQSARELGYYRSISNFELMSNEELEKRKKIIANSNTVVFSVGDDQISNDLQKYYKSCESFLKSHQSKFKIS
ncbi:hypothetical protein [Sphingobacterium multivorum]|uniref:hypothetical protein n=1 Tax=Sphingobacterium multivorum TaxID=28454 RepID=UPI002FDA7977